MDPAEELHDNSPIGSRQDEQAVIICLPFPRGKREQQKALDAVCELGNILHEIVESANVGTYGGYVFCETPEEESVKFFLSGAKARAIYQEVQPVLPNLPGSYIIKRYSRIVHEVFV